MLHDFDILCDVNNVICSEHGVILTLGLRTSKTRQIIRDRATATLRQLPFLRKLRSYFEN